MKFSKIFSAAVVMAAVSGVTSVCSAQSSANAAVNSASTTKSDAPYTEGAVWQITMVKTKPGMGDDYLKGLAKTFKATNDEARNKASLPITKS